MLRTIVCDGSRCTWRLRPRRILGKVTTNVISQRMSSFDGKEDEVHAGTMDEIKYEIMRRLGLEQGYSRKPPTRDHLLQYHPELKDLPERSMYDSFTSATIPLSGDKSLQEKYASQMGTVRKGRLMEDLDLFAGKSAYHFVLLYLTVATLVWVCQKHVLLPNLPEDVHLPYTFVTILADQMALSDLRTVFTEDVRVSGHVSWVGRTSMEITMWLDQMYYGSYENITKAYFIMAARNATNMGSAPVNPLKPANDEEKQILDDSIKRQEKRKQIRGANVHKIQPTEAEQLMIYQLVSRTTPPQTMELNRRVLPSNCRWMTNSYCVSSMPPFPEHRNAHYTVFGGFLIRQALEIGWITGCVYSSSRVATKFVSEIHFDKPVTIYSLIKMTAYIVYTNVNYMQVKVLADILNTDSESESLKQITSDVFFLTLMSNAPVPEVLPRSYHEALWYIQGRRKFNNAFGFN